MDDPYKRIFNIQVDKDADLSDVRSNELLGCPFCGAEVGAIGQFGDGQWGRRCSRCPAQIRCRTFEEVDVAWNRRAT